MAVADAVDMGSFNSVLLIVALFGIAAVLSNRLGERLPIPAPALFLVGAGIASDMWPGLDAVSMKSVQQIVTVALVVILFDGGMHIGWRRFRSAAGAIVWIGVVGTLVTAIAVAACAHWLCGLDWRISLLLGTALAPTDPAVVFSVLGRREITGRSGILLQGESGANDPVGIALLIALLGATSFTSGAVWSAVAEFAVQMSVGAAVGIVGGVGLGWFMRRVPLPAAGLYSLRVLMCAVAIYGVAAQAHGSGFLAVLVAGIVIGDQRAPFKAEIERFHSALANLAEIVAFILLGLTIQLTGPQGVAKGHAWLIGLVLAVLLAVVIRPVLVGMLLYAVRLTGGERVFVLWTGLKGAVPILMGTFIVNAGLPDAQRAYEVIFVVVAFSVVVQGGAVPGLARRMRVPVREVNPTPWGLDVRLEHEPRDMHRFTVVDGSIAAGSAIAELPAENFWVSFIIRDGHLLTGTAEAVLEPGDQVLVLAEPTAADDLAGLFAHPDDPHRWTPTTRNPPTSPRWLRAITASAHRRATARPPDATE